MSRVELVNIVKKITQLSQRDKADLVRILEEALEGGGGDTSKFITVEPQDFTEAQQMQARKNQGLYYEQIAKSEANIELSQFIYGSEHYTWKNIGFYIQGIRDETDNIVPYTAPKSISDVHSFGWKTSYSESTPITDIDVVVGESAVLLSEGLYLLYGPGANIVDGPSNPSKNYQYCIVALEGNTENLTPGFYYPYYNEQSGIPEIVNVKYLAEETVLVPIPEKYLSEAKGIKYVPQELSQEEQMQARKNQGLYYSEGGGEDVTINWDGDTTGLETIGGLYKLSEDAPPASEVKSVSIIHNGVEETYEVGVSPAQIVEVEGGYAIGSLACLVIMADEVTVQGTTYTKGIWFVYASENNRTSKLVYGQTETIHHIDPKYIKDMYYTEGEDEEKTVDLIFAPLPSDWRETLIILEGGDLGYARYSTDIPNIDDWVQIVIQENITPAERLSFQQNEGYYTIREGYVDYQIIVVQTDGATIPDVGSPISTGIYVLSRCYGNPPTTIESIVDSMTYNLKATVHQIPQKYLPLPSGGFQTYDINMNWSDIDEIIRQGYGYAQGIFNEDEYNNLREALYNGKMIALNIGQGSYGYPGGKLLTGNYLPLNSENEDGYESEIVFPVINWVTYNPNTGNITGSAKYIIGLKCGYGVETGEFKYEFVANLVNPAE